MIWRRVDVRVVARLVSQVQVEGPTAGDPPGTRQPALEVDDVDGCHRLPGSEVLPHPDIFAGMRDGLICERRAWVISLNQDEVR